MFYYFQVMYAYVMRPETLPESYLEFIVRTGPIAKPVLKAVRESCRNEPIDMAPLSAFVLSRNGGIDMNLDQNCQLIPCAVIHPDTVFCTKQIAKATNSTFKKTFPLYMSLTFVPFVVLNLQKVRISSFLFSYIFQLYYHIVIHLFVKLCTGV